MVQATDEIERGFDSRSEPDQAQDAAANVRLSVIMPALNEEGAVGEVVRELFDALDDWPEAWEVIVVDDGSSDGTAAAALAAGATVIRRPERGGYGAAVKTGLRRARGEWVALLDADGTYDPAALPGLLALMPDYDQVNGARQRDWGRLAGVRWLVKWLITRLAEWISSKRIEDLNTGMKVFKRDLALDYLWALPDGFSAVSSLTLAFLCDGRLVTYRPIPYRERTGPSKFRPIRDTAQYLATILRLILYFRPLRVFLPLAALFLIVAVPKAAWDILYSPTGLHDADVMLFGFGALIAVAGMLAELIVAQRRGG